MADTPPDLLAQFAKALGMDEATATPDAVLATLGTRLGDAAKVTTERDEAVAEVEKIRGERDAERIDAAISAALGKSTMIPANAPDALNLMRPLFHVDDKGRVVTKGGDTGEVPGIDPAQFAASRLGSLRPHWFPASAGAGAKGGGIVPSAGVDVSAFKGGTLTDQMALIGRVGEKAVIDALRRSGIAAPAWLKGGGR
jgi:hypothetical protein